MTDIAAAMRSLRPGARWSLSGDELSGLDWPKQETERPADNEIIAEVKRLAAIALLPPVPEWISDRQFAQGLAMSGLITEVEAEEWVGPGVVPAALMAFVDALPSGQQFPARMLLRGATQFERRNPLTEAFGALQGWSAGQVDQFWRDCAKL